MELIDIVFELKLETERLERHMKRQQEINDNNTNLIKYLNEKLNQLKE